VTFFDFVVLLAVDADADQRDDVGLAPQAVEAVAVHAAYPHGPERHSLRLADGRRVGRHARIGTGAVLRSRHAALDLVRHQA